MAIPHAGTCDNAVVTAVSVTATLKHVGVVVDVKVVAAVLEQDGNHLLDLRRS